MKLATITAGLRAFRRSLVGTSSTDFTALKGLKDLPKLASQEVTPLLAQNTVELYKGRFKQDGKSVFITVVSGKSGTDRSFADFTAYSKKGERLGTLPNQPLWDDLAE